jgi:gliding motility-associated-like protein
MYQGGHFHNGAGGPNTLTSDHIALQRAFFNFSFLAVIDRQNNVQTQINAAPTMTQGMSYPVRFTVPPEIDLNKYTIRWSASSGQILPNEASRDITYIPPVDASIRIALITLILTDACGRQYFQTHNVNLLSDPDNDGKVKVPQLVSPNGDGSGYDYLHIRNIELYPDNQITIYNRWGNIVYEEKGYDNSVKFFTGNLKMKSTLVTDGVFYYVLKVNTSGSNASSSP